MTEIENARNATLTVGTAVVVVSDQPNTNCFRKYITIENTSTGGQEITLSFGAEAVIGAGEKIYPGGLHHESVDSGFKPWQERITAISNLAGGTLSIMERIVVRQ